MNIVNLFFGLDGRISRKQFWLGIVIVVAVEIALLLALGVPLDSDAEPDRRVRTIKAVIDLVVLYPTVAIAVKRLHDRNQTGAYAWLIVALGIIAAVLDFMGFVRPSPDLGFAFWVFSAAILVIGLAFLIELGFRRGTPGDNRFGPDPLVGRA